MLHQYQALLENVHILPCEVFIDECHCYIGATPDGLIGTDTIVEIKCLITASKQELTKAIVDNKIRIFKYNKKKTKKLV